MDKEYFIYIMTNRSRTLYTGVTGDLEGRVYQHKCGHGSTFTSKYKINQLIYYESFTSVYDAIAREKQIKGYRREKKIELIEQENSDWVDLNVDWYL